MNQRRQSQKRDLIAAVGQESYRFPFGIDFGSIAIAALIGLITVIAAAVPKESASADLEPGKTPKGRLAASQTLSIDELLIAMRHRLSREQVETNISFAKSVMRIMTDGPMFALSQADILSKKAKDARAVANTLAWAIHCHIDFGSIESEDTSNSSIRLLARSDGSICQLPKIQPVQFDRSTCLPGKGRVQLGQISFQGHADSVPFRQNTQSEFKDNHVLSQERATRFAKQVLACTQEDLQFLGSTKDIPFESTGLSDSWPAVSNSRDPINRRVEIHFDATSRTPGNIEIR